VALNTINQSTNQSILTINNDLQNIVFVEQLIDKKRQEYLCFRHICNHRNYFQLYQ
jgi:hypothetical protein